MRRRTARELTALADCSLAPERRQALLARIARSAKLARALEEQRFAIAAVRGLTVRAPDGLRAWVERATREASAARTPAERTPGRGALGRPGAPR